MTDYKAEAERLALALDTYFGNASADQGTNILRATPIIREFGEVSVTGGLAWIVRDIHAMSEYTVSKALSVPGDILNATVVGRVMTTMAYMHDFLEANDPITAQSWLMASLGQYHEDIRALGAYFLADNLWKLSVPSQFRRVRTVYSFTEGNSCQTALALALFMGGDRELMREIISRGYFGPREKHSMLVQMVQSTKPDAGAGDAEMMATLMMVVPEVLGAGPGDAGLIKMLALDIESNGRSCRAIPGWKRKQYERE